MSKGVASHGGHRTSPTAAGFAAIGTTTPLGCRISGSRNAPPVVVLIARVAAGRGGPRGASVAGRRQLNYKGSNSAVKCLSTFGAAVMRYPRSRSRWRATSMAASAT